MANRTFKQVIRNLVPNLTSIYGLIQFGSSGAVSTVSGNGIKGVSRLKIGVYSIQLQDNYAAFLTSKFQLESPPAGSPVADGSFVAATLYQITVVGTTNWAAIGVPTGILPAVGVPFVATGVGGAGTGTATAVTDSGVSRVEVIQMPGLQLNNTSGVSNSGAYILFQVLAPTSAGVTTAIPANPAVNCVLRFELQFRDSQLTA